MPHDAAIRAEPAAATAILPPPAVLTRHSSRAAAIRSESRPDHDPVRDVLHDDVLRAVVVGLERSRLDLAFLDQLLGACNHAGAGEAPTPSTAGMVLAGVRARLDRLQAQLTPPGIAADRADRRTPTEPTRAVSDRAVSDRAGVDAAGVNTAAAHPGGAG